MKAVLFDLDGTLLPMNEDTFVKGYMGRLYKYLAPYGYDDPNAFIAAIWYGVKAMRKNDGKRSCDEVYWEAFNSQFEGKDGALAHKKFDEFYATDFKNAKQYCFEAHKNAQEIINKCREKADLLIVVSNPVFPLIAMQERVEFAGIDPLSFDFITSYETSHFAKPNKMFIQEVLDRFNLKSDEVVYFGNSEKEDAKIAKELGIKFYLTGNIVREEGSVEKYNEIEFDKIPTIL